MKQSEGVFNNSPPALPLPSLFTWDFAMLERHHVTATIVCGFDGDVIGNISGGSTDRGSSRNLFWDAIEATLGIILQQGRR